MNDEDEVVVEAHEPEGTEEPELADMEEAAGSAVAKLKKELTQVKAEKQEYLDGWQRSKADYANLVRRGEEETKEASSRGASRAAEALLPALDSLGRAKTAGELPESLGGVVKQLEAGFAKLGLVQFGTVGEAFDPALHEALGTDAAASAAENDTISAVLEPGYKMGERVIRPAKVRVAHLA